MHSDLQDKDKSADETKPQSQSCQAKSLSPGAPNQIMIQNKRYTIVPKYNLNGIPGATPTRIM